MKYCSNCGSGLSDDTAFCSNCGAKQENDIQPAPAPKKSKTPFIIAAAIVLCAIPAIILISSIAGGKGYESAFKNFCSAINNQDINKLYKILPPTLEKQIKAAVSLSGMDDPEIVEEILDLGEVDVKVSYHINDAVRMTSDELADYAGNSYDLFSSDSSSKVTDGYYTDVTLTITIDGETEEEDYEMTVVKIDGRWCFATDFCQRKP